MGATGNDSFDRARRGVLRDLYGTAPHASKLAVCFDGARRQVEILADGIRVVMPELTDHSLDHIDALWDYVGHLHGQSPLNPAEAFVLGGAILLHDLAMTPAAHPHGFPPPGGELELRDLEAAVFRRRTGRPPTAADLDDLDDDVRSEAERAYLRRHHAQGARALATRPFPPAAGSETLTFVFDDEDLRAHYGPTIGQIAESHWWDHDRLVDELGDEPPLAAPVALGQDWPVDRLRLACLLRCADAAHLDRRRADPLRRRLQAPPPGSAEHWDFQARTSGVMVHERRLVYDAPQGFPIEEARAWWLGFRMLRDVVDHEIRACQDILEAHDRAPFRVIGVAGVESVDHFRKRFRTTGWRPIDAEIRVGDTGQLVEMLGGRQLYGDHPEVVLRELVQNARDAVAARRVVDPEAGEGRVTVRFDLAGADGRASLTVSDTGVGMTERTITDRLLVLGNSSWRTDDVIEELPGLASSDFDAVGRFGIGFFSVSMVADAVEVRTRHLTKGPDDTLIVEIDDDLGRMPILREAVGSDRRLHPGTDVRIDMDVAMLDDIVGGFSGDPAILFEIAAIRVLALLPMLDCRLVVMVGDHVVGDVAADAWMTMGADELSEIVGVLDDEDDLVAPMDGTLIVVHDDDGTPMGRVGLVGPTRHYGASVLVTVGGLHADEQWNSPLIGLLRGSDPSITRHEATAELPARARADLCDRLTHWLEEHAGARGDDEVTVRAVLAAAGDDVDPVVFTVRRGFVHWSTLVTELADRDQVLLLSPPLDHPGMLPSALRHAEGRYEVAVSPRLAAHRGEVTEPLDPDDLVVTYRIRPSDLMSSPYDGDALATSLRRAALQRHQADRLLRSAPEARTVLAIVETIDRSSSVWEGPLAEMRQIVGSHDVHLALMRLRHPRVIAGTPPVDEEVLQRLAARLPSLRDAFVASPLLTTDERIRAAATLSGEAPYTTPARLLEPEGGAMGLTRIRPRLLRDPDPDQD